MNLVFFSCVPWASDGVFTSRDTGCGFISVARRTGGDEENTPFHPYSPYAFAKQLKKNKLYVVVLYVRV